MFYVDDGDGAIVDRWRAFTLKTKSAIGIVPYEARAANAEPDLTIVTLDDVA